MWVWRAVAASHGMWFLDSRNWQWAGLICSFSYFILYFMLLHSSTCLAISLLCIRRSVQSFLPDSKEQWLVPAWFVRSPLLKYVSSLYVGQLAKSAFHLIYGDPSNQPYQVAIKRSLSQPEMFVLHLYTTSSAYIYVHVSSSHTISLVAIGLKKPGNKVIRDRSV